MEVVRQSRSRAASLIGFASVIAVALGLSTQAGVHDVFAWCGLVSYLIVVGAAIYVMLPRVFHYTLRANRMDAWFNLPENLGNEHMLRSAALAHDANYAFNKRTVMWMQAGVVLGMFGLGAEAVFLFLGLVLS
jgi:hypothetical protein